MEKAKREIVYRKKQGADSHPKRVSRKIKFWKGKDPSQELLDVKKGFGNKNKQCE